MTRTSPAPDRHPLNCSCFSCCTERRDEVAKRLSGLPAYDLASDIVRYESSDDRGTVCTSLMLASAEPPTDPESRIVQRGGRLLAECDPERCAWAFSAVGKARIEAEARAEYLRDVGDDVEAEREAPEVDEDEDSWMDAVGQ